MPNFLTTKNHQPYWISRKTKCLQERQTETNHSPGKQKRFFSLLIENQPIILCQKQQQTYANARHNSLSNGGVYLDTANKEVIHQQKRRCNWRTVVLIVQIIMTVIGVAIFWIFVRARDTQKQAPYTNLAPVNDWCAVASKTKNPSNSKQFFTDKIETQATTIGATVTENPCDSSLDHVGVWYSVIGTGGPISAATQNESSTDVRLSILSGQCDDFTCISSSNNSGHNAEVSTSWMSIVGESYYILVHGEASRAGNFSLSLSGKTPRNSECDAAPSLFLPLNHASTFTITGTTEVSAMYRIESVCNSLSEIGSISWYSLTGNGNVLTVSNCDDDSDQFLDKEIMVRVYNGRCNDLECLAVDNEGADSMTIGSQRGVNWLSIPGQRYYVFVSSPKRERTTFKLCLHQSS
mmetsp:Transcript_9243/g.21919  ORF Transcript_9243/g.21919 Transcript_9243/m.21919 type:complete len:408 (+) Transcript_9243:492-1715(+)